MNYNEIETFCREKGFLFHKNGSGTFGADRYWSFCKVESNDRTLFSIDYFPVRGTIKVRRGTCTYQGGVESVAHLVELLAVMRIGEWA